MSNEGAGVASPDGFAGKGSAARINGSVAPGGAADPLPQTLVSRNMESFGLDGRAGVDAGGTAAPGAGPGRSAVPEGVDPPSVPRIPPFDPDQVGGRLNAVQRFLSQPPLWFLWLLRTFAPIARLPRWAFVSRYDDVLQVLSRPDVFTVPYGAEMARLNDGREPGTKFILGVDDVQERAAQLKWLMQAFQRSDVSTTVVPLCRCSATEAVEKSGGFMDAIPDLITAVPLKVCAGYYGVTIPAHRARDFAWATIALSGHLFGPPPIDKTTSTPVIEAAGVCVREIVDAAIDAESATPSGRDTVLARLVHASRADAALTRQQVRAILIGMIVGFVPTNTMAGGHILDTLLRKPRALAAAQEAAVAGDDTLLKHTLLEALRFMPLNPGPFRICSVDGFTLAPDTLRAVKLKKGTRVLASTMSAMFDSRQVKNPFDFVPGRPASDYLLFGYGLHWCAGRFIAEAQITQTFKALVLQPGLRRVGGRAGELKLRGAFPDHLLVMFDPPEE